MGLQTQFANAFVQQQGTEKNDAFELFNLKIPGRDFLDFSITPGSSILLAETANRRRGLAIEKASRVSAMSVNAITGAPSYKTERITLLSKSITV